MNIYLLVEGETEYYAYPNIIKEICPVMNQVYDVAAANRNNFFIFSANGFPSILDMIEPSIVDAFINNKYDKLLIVLDIEEETQESLMNKVHRVLIPLIHKYDYNFDNVVIVLQNKCFETWCLGNRDLIAEDSTDDIFDFLEYFDVRYLDPEDMPRDESLKGCNTVQQYHFYFLRKLFKRRGWIYNKASRTNKAYQPEYIRGIIRRAQETNHIKSFKFVHTFLNSVNFSTAATNE